MALTAEQQTEFERYAHGLLDAAIGGDDESRVTLVKWVTSTGSIKLAKFKAWATEERSREAQAAADADARVTRDKAARATRDTTLAEIENLTRL